MLSLRTRAFLLCLLASSLSGLAWPLATQAVSYTERVQEKTLGNGLKLILLEDWKAPVAVFQIWYRVGSRNETVGRTGQSHLLEHMMFKGTEVVGPEEYGRIIQRNGGQSNAFTSQDATTYFATLMNDRLKVVIDLEADRMTNLQLAPELYVAERAVVQEERRLRIDNNPVSSLFELLGATSYEVHPYRLPIIGWMSDIAQSTVQDLELHYRTYYKPNNAFIVVAGAFDSEALAATIEEAFGRAPRGDPPPSVRSIEPTQSGEKRVKLRREAELPFLAFSYHVPNLSSRDAAPLEVLAAVLAGGRSSHLHRQLVYEQRLARQAGASYDYDSIDSGQFVVYAQPLPGQSSASVERALLAEVEKIVTASPTEQELRKAKNGIEANSIFAQDSLFYQGMVLAQFELAGGWRLIDEYLPSIRAVSGEDVLRVARFYLRPDNRTVAELVPWPEAPGPASLEAAPAGRSGG